VIEVESLDEMKFKLRDLRFNLSMERNFIRRMVFQIRYSILDRKIFHQIMNDFHQVIEEEIFLKKL
jgi:hypothetical protein